MAGKLSQSSEGGPLKVQPGPTSAADENVSCKKDEDNNANSASDISGGADFVLFLLQNLVPFPLF